MSPIVKPDLYNLKKLYVHIKPIILKRSYNPCLLAHLLLLYSFALATPSKGGTTWLTQIRLQV